MSPQKTSASNDTGSTITAPSSTQPTFRLAAESDADTILAFMRDYYAFDGHGFNEPQARVALTTLLRDSNLGRAWLIFDNATPAGYIVLCFGYSLEWLGRDAFVDEFFLLPNYRGRGWGNQTMQFLEAEARALHVRALHLEVVEENKVALKIYKKLGFKQHPSTFHSKWIAQDATKPKGTHGY